MTARRLMLAFLVAALFGLVAGVLHGNGGGLRGEAANLSTPWLLVALIPAWWTGSAGRGALVGTVCTLIALSGFYLGLTKAEFGHLGQLHGWVASFELIVRANDIWFAAGLVSGPLFGALGGALGARRSPRWIVAACGALMVGEVLVARVVQGVSLPLIGGWSITDWRVYEVEALVGIAVLLALAVAGRPTRHAR